MEHVIDICYGVIPYFKRKDNEIEFLVVTQEHAHTSFPKGHPNPEEKPEDTAIRELAEETGITNAVLNTEKIYTTSYSFEDYDNKIHDKTVYFYLAEIPEQTAVTPEAFSKEITAMQWGLYEKIRSLLTHENTRLLLDDARRDLLHRYGNSR
jgi:8-oxo-dGTP pyrophosphatase MutT (NUDIX family)